MSTDAVPADFESLVAEAEARPVRGWDFSWLRSRMVTSRLPWDYDALVVRRARSSPNLLDLGTGGGEWLAALAVRPPRTVATEAWQPNVDVARARLGPLGVTVVRVEGAPDNVDQNDDVQRSSLPFPDESFRLVVCRHEAYMPMEVARILVAGGHFVTQQVGGDYGDFYRLLGLPGPSRPAREWNLTLATAQLEAAGLRLLAADEGEETTTFADVGALVWYLRAVPWALPGFTASEHLSGLRELHARLVTDGPAAVCMPAFFLEATKVAAS